MERVIKCVAVGDAKIGKTDLIQKFSKGRYIPADYESQPVTSFENCNVKGVTVDGEPYSLRLFDTGSLEDSLPSRLRLYPNTDIFLICFSVIVPTSFESIKTQWLPEIRQNCPAAKFLIIGLQVDLRHTLKKTLARGENLFITTEEGNSLARELGAIKYVECSSHARSAMKKVFDEVILGLMKADRNYKGKEKSACMIM
uniref:Ras-related C3 botulinum toxin substrate 1 n=1 Tax=Syphacia muris TaxID=451379 RepID=A0A0N5AI47_9BILA